MEMLRKLLNTINLKWSQKAKINRVLSIRQGSGSFPYLTITEGVLYFHEYPQVESFGMANYVQQVVLEGMTLQDLTDTVTGMGYEVDTSNAVQLGAMGESALTILDVRGQYIIDWFDLFGFESNWHRVIYPISRILSKFDGDIDAAIEALMLPSAQSEWLDYWAGFLRIKRLPDETDELMLRRVMLTLTSAKSNNVAMKEIISYYIGTEAQVLDNAPAKIEVRVDPYYMDSANKVNDIIVLLKGAGVAYFLNYQKAFDENYQNYFLNNNGSTFGTVNNNSFGGTIQFPVYAEDYQYIPPEQQTSLRLNTQGTLNSYYTLSKPDKKIIDSVSMVMTDSSGNIIQQM